MGDNVPTTATWQPGKPELFKEVFGGQVSKKRLMAA